MNLSKFTIEQKQQMYDLYEQGYSKTHIAQMLVFSREVCRLIINQYIVDKIKTENIYIRFYTIILFSYCNFVYSYLFNMQEFYAWFNSLYEDC